MIIISDLPSVPYLTVQYHILALIPYTAYAGWAVTARIPVKFGTAHGESRPEVGSTKRIGASSQKGVPPAPRIFGTSDYKIMTPTVFVGPKHNFYSLTVCNLDQYLRNGSEKTDFLSH